MKKLTEKQENFCRYYIETDGNASESYRMAYDASRMDGNAIAVEAKRLKDLPKITLRIDELREERRKASEPSRKLVEGVLMDIVMADPNDIYITDKKTGRIKLRTPSQLPKRARNAMKKISNKRGDVTYEFNGKTEAASLLARMNGWEAPKQVNVSSGEKPISELRIGFDEEE